MGHPCCVHSSQKLFTRLVEDSYQGTPSVEELYQGTPRVEELYQGTPRVEELYQGTPSGVPAMNHLERL
jgi:hypothetical protein